MAAQPVSSIHILSSETFRHFCHKSVFVFVCYGYVLFYERVCLSCPELLAKVVASFLPAPSELPVSAKTIPDLGQKAIPPQLCYRISFYGKFVAG